MARPVDDSPTPADFLDAEDGSLQSAGPDLGAPFFRSAEALGIRFRRTFPPTRLFDLTAYELETLLDESGRERLEHLRRWVADAFDPMGRSFADLVVRPETTAQFVTARFAGSRQELFGALFVDGSNRCLAWDVLHRGTLTRATVEPRTILAEALRLGAERLIVFHTHPTGDPKPSREDVRFTRRLAEAAELLGLRLVDHWIVGRGGRWVSLEQRGGW